MQTFKLTEENYQKGFLVDQEMLAGVTQMVPNNSPSETQQSASTGFLVFVVNQLTGESVFQEVYPRLQDALIRISQMPRQWKFESVSQCGGGSCKGGACAVNGSCHKKFHDPQTHLNTNSSSS